MVPRSKYYTAGPQQVPGNVQNWTLLEKPLGREGRGSVRKLPELPWCPPRKPTRKQPSVRGALENQPVGPFWDRDEALRVVLSLPVRSNLRVGCV